MSDKGINRMLVGLVASAALPAALFAAEPAQPPAASDADAFAVSVNGVKLTQREIDADVGMLLEAQGARIPVEQREYAKQAFANQVVQGFIVAKVLASRAKADGHVVTDEDRKAREAEMLKAMEKMPDPPKSAEEYFKKFPLGEERARAEFDTGILIDKLIRAELAKAPKKDFAAEAKKRIDELVARNAKANADESASRKRIGELKAQLDKVPAAQLAEEFARLAKEHSACPSSQKGGDLGLFTHGQMVKEFDEVAFKTPVGEVSDPVKTTFGYHLVFVTKKIPAVEAKGDSPAEPEKVQASHILLKSGKVQKVPTVEEMTRLLQKQEERSFSQEFVQKQLKAAKIEASDPYKRFVPSAD